MAISPLVHLGLQKKCHCVAVSDQQRFTELQCPKPHQTDNFRFLLQVGTAVVTRPDGRLSLGRLGSLCEQVEDLLSDGIEVILVSSGAVGVGRQKLRYQKMIHSTLKELHQMKKHEPDTKACAAIGQSGLMALYDALFGQVRLSEFLLLCVFDSALCELDAFCLLLQLWRLLAENLVQGQRGLMALCGALVWQVQIGVHSFLFLSGC